MKNEDRASASDVSRLTCFTPSESCEYSADPVSQTTPSDKRTVEKITFEAREFFTSLSIINQKEYLSWIQGAKKEETKQKRLEATMEKLMAGKNNPSEK